MEFWVCKHSGEEAWKTPQWRCLKLSIASCRNSSLQVMKHVSTSIYLMTRASWPLVPHLKLFFSEYFNDFRVDSIAFVLVYSCKGCKGGEGNVTPHIARFLQDVNDSHVQHLPTVSSISLPKNLGMNPLGQPSFYSQNAEMLTESVAIPEPPTCQFQNIKYHQFPQVHHLHPNLLFHPKLFTIYAPIRKSFACFAELDKDTPNLASWSWIWTTVFSLSNCPSCQVDFWFSEKWLRRVLLGGLSSNDELRLSWKTAQLTAQLKASSKTAQLRVAWKTAELRPSSKTPNICPRPLDT